MFVSERTMVAILIISNLSVVINVLFHIIASLRLRVDKLQCSPNDKEDERTAPQHSRFSVLQ